jgi:hypothetical protein
MPAMQMFQAQRNDSPPLAQILAATTIVLAYRGNFKRIQGNNILI